MRFPSLAHLAGRAATVLRRFPWTLAAAVLAASAAITATATHGSAVELWARVAFVAALGLPVTLALALLAEQRHWSDRLRITGHIAGGLGLAAFFFVWPGIDETPDAIRYFQLSAALHLAVAFLPFLGAGGTLAFWQYNRRLFEGFLRAVAFSGVLFVGIAIALAALDHLFGAHIDGETYLRIWLVIALVVNTWIFLAAVPEDLAALEHDTGYPRPLKVFAQYILTPLVFTYLMILLAYLVKILAGGEWPSGWIGWLVASVSVTGLLGFLLVYPLRTDPAEGWIRTYARWLFVGLVPAALMLLAAFWKRIVPYGLTEPRVLGIVLGLWLLGIALLFVVRSGASIRMIPITLAILLLLTLYGPWSLSRLSISSQGRRLARMLATPDSTGANAREASAALRFLIERRAAREIAARIGHELPAIDWKTASQYQRRDEIGSQIMGLVGRTYTLTGPGSEWFNLGTMDPTSVAGFDWMVPVTSGNRTARVAGADTVAVVERAASGAERIRVGPDTLEFDVQGLARRQAGANGRSGTIPAEQLRIELGTNGRRRVLAISEMNGARTGDSVRVDYWRGWLLVGR
jgi:hypothetical protein